MEYEKIFTSHVYDMRLIEHNEFLQLLNKQHKYTNANKYYICVYTHLHIQIHPYYRYMRVFVIEIHEKIMKMYDIKEG